MMDDGLVAMACDGDEQVLERESHDSPPSWARGEGGGDGDGWI